MKTSSEVLQTPFPYNLERNKEENAHRYAVRGKKERETHCDDGDTLWWRKHTVMKNITRKGYHDTKGGQENVTMKRWIRKGNLVYYDTKENN